jgi:hypothetical protein
VRSPSYQNASTGEIVNGQFEDEPLAAQYLAALLDDARQVNVVGSATEETRKNRRLEESVGNVWPDPALP